MGLEIREVTGADREAVYRLRYEIYVAQCGYRFASDHAHRSLYQPEMDDQATILGAFADGRLVGSARVVWGGNQDFTDELCHIFRLESYLGVVGPDRIQIVGAAAILDAHAARVATPLFQESARIAAARGVLLSLLVCQPHHVRLYETLGALSSGPPAVYPMGVTFPFAYLLDASHYRDMRSPLRAIIERGDAAPDIIAALRALLPDPPPVLTAGNAPDLFRRRVAEGLTRIAEAGLRDVATVQELQPLLDDSIVFDLPAGMLLTGKDMRHQTIYLVLDGVLEIVDDGEVIGLCEAGGYVGEVAFLLNRRRMSDVRGGPNGARLLAFGTRALSRRTDAAGPFWRSVAADACAKLVATAERRI